MRDKEDDNEESREDSFKHKQGSKKAEQSGEREQCSRLWPCKWEFTSGQSEGLSVVLRQLIYLATWCLHNGILWKLVEDI